MTDPEDAEDARPSAAARKALEEMWRRAIRDVGTCPSDDPCPSCVERGHLVVALDRLDQLEREIAGLRGGEKEMATVLPKEQGG